MQICFSGLVPLLGFFALACSASSGDPTPTASSSTSTGTGGVPDGTGGEFNVPSGTGGGFAGGFSVGGGPSFGPDGSCSGIVNQAEKRIGGEADIIWVLDNSFSMVDEAAGIQQNMNAFSQFIAGTGIDVRVVVISAGSPATNLIDVGVCVGPPLGSGSCPNDSNPPNYMRVDVTVDSHNALAQTLATYDLWRSMLRPTSKKTFVYVSDDEALPIPSAADFIAWANSQPELQGGYRVSGIFCQNPIVPLACFAAGNTYQALVDQTGGIAVNLPNANWQAIFQQLADAVVADAVPVDCEWIIPAPPTGETLDPNLVNVRFKNRDGITETMYGVADQNACMQDFLGWYYDNPTTPTRVIACPQTCPVIQADDEAQISIEFGCAKEEPPIR